LVEAAVDDTVVVIDGPATVNTSKDVIWIGYDADPDGSGDAASSDQGWKGAASRARDETVNVFGAVFVSFGSTGVKAARDRAYVLLALVEDTVHGLPDLGLNPPTSGGVSSHRLIYRQAESGIQACILFTLTVQTRL